MTVEKKTDFEIDHKFDPITNRHYMNGFCTVLHCHHYATLYTQLADDAEQFKGISLLKEASEDTFYEVLDDYYKKHGIETIDEKVSIAEQYWQAVGMGLIRFTGVGKYATTAVMEYSHLDEGWLKKWGSRDKPVNFFTCGFVAAVAALINGKKPRSFTVKEHKGLVCGDDVSSFKAVLS
jgi:hypothetical protein